MNSYEIIKYIADSKRSTPLKVFLRGDLGSIDFNGMEFYGDTNMGNSFL